MLFNSKIFLGLILLTALLQTGCDNNSVQSRIYRIGIINPSSGLNEVVDGFKLGMAELGYKEGENLTYIDYGPVKLNDVNATTKQMLALGIDLLYTTTTKGTQIVKEAVAGTNTPVVFAPMFAPEKSGVVDSLIKPGGNITGVKVGGSSTNTFHWLMKILPDTKNIFIPFHCTDPAASMCFFDVNLAAIKAGVTITQADVTSKQELQTALKNLPENTDAIWLSCSPLIFSNIKEIVAAASARKIPVASTTHQQVEGVMISYGVNNILLGKQASRIADLILQGTSPADIPVETAEFLLSINLKVANQLGIEIPTYILRQADSITH
ncbi:MAG: ABC transporter substrate-binding protein [Desulfobulbaceae bacterium]|nr:ABC transporter substrate-binding protein [Desulfobulbaceae bacterium]